MMYLYQLSVTKFI